jgi:restriction system protein
VLIVKAANWITERNRSKKRDELHRFIHQPLSDTDAVIKETIVGITKSVDIMNGGEFERFIGRLLSATGYKNVRVTQQSGDYGVDITADFGEAKYVFQCKRYDSNVGIKAIQEIYTGQQYYEADVAVCITNSYFTEQAKTTAKRTCVLLWDRDKLLSMIDSVYNEKSLDDIDNISNLVIKQEQAKEELKWF